MNEPIIKTESEKVKECIGIFIDIKGTEKIRSFLSKTKAEKYTEVCVILQGERKDFTLQEFKTRLGFEHNEIEWCE